MAVNVPADILEAAELDRDVRITPVHGGDINQSAKVLTSEEAYFLKWHERPPDHFFQKEAKQLKVLAEAPGVYVPEVVNDGECHLLLTWVEGRKTSETEEQLGQMIALLHQQKGRYFGFEENNFIGTMTQFNAEQESWIDFYREYRLLPQIEEADRRGRMPRERRRQAEQLLDRLYEWIAEPAYPALLHGDLWAGNWLVGKEGQPYLIDPAISYGDPAFDRAMMSLFGGFSSQTLASYHASVERHADEDTVLPIYQLYFLFAHLNMFGEIYGGSVDRILNRYTS